MDPHGRWEVPPQGEISYTSTSFEAPLPTQLPFPNTPQYPAALPQAQNEWFEVRGMQPPEAQTKTGEKEAKKEENANERLLVFSDGIIAFALTVAAITIKIPANTEQLEANSTSIMLRCFMYIVAFIIVASAWVDHHTIFHYVKRNTTFFVIQNFFYLAAIVMFPIGLFFLEFGAELSGVDDTVSTNQILLGLGVFLGSQIIAGVALAGMWIHAKKHNHLLLKGLDPRLISYTTMRLFSKPAMLIFMLLLAYSALYVPLIAVPVLVVAFILRDIYFRLKRRKLDLTVGTDDTKRIQLFSDAVIGIAITLSVAQIEFPSLGEDSKKALDAVSNQWPLLHAFVVGIVIMGVYWLFHYNLFRLVKRHDPQLVFLNCFFLLDMALMIIPVNWFVNYYDVPGMGAYLFFGCYQIMTSLVLVVMWRHIASKRRLLLDHVTVRRNRQFGIVVIAQPIIFLLLTILSRFIHALLPSIYIALYLLILASVWLLAQGGVRQLSRHFRVNNMGETSASPL